MPSPWEAALGREVESLHPRLRAYFSQIPDGAVGRGAGVFDVVGTPRRWLWPVLAVLGLDGVLFAAWHSDVLFEVENRPAEGAVNARRTFEFPGRPRHMLDSVRFLDGQLSDRLGRHALVVARLEAKVEAGELHLRSTGVRVAGVPLPRRFAPRLTLTERWDDTAGKQHVALQLDAPGLGRLYEYNGHFSYEIMEN